MTSLGFPLTLIAIRLIPPLECWVGWEWTVVYLALGPIVDVWAMCALRRLISAALQTTLALLIASGIGVSAALRTNAIPPF